MNNDFCILSNVLHNLAHTVQENKAPFYYCCLCYYCYYRFNVIINNNYYCTVDYMDKTKAMSLMITTISPFLFFTEET